MQSIEKTIKSALPPTLTNVFWLDISGEKPILKAFKNGQWLPVSSEDTEVKKLQEKIEELEDGKVDKIEGKELSSNDFTDELKVKLETLDETAEGVHIKSDWNAQSGESGEILNRPGIDNVPTLNSNNLVKSGGVAEKIGQLGQEIAELDGQINGVEPYSESFNFTTTAGVADNTKINITLPRDGTYKLKYTGTSYPNGASCTFLSRSTGSQYVAVSLAEGEEKEIDLVVSDIGKIKLSTSNANTYAGTAILTIELVNESIVSDIGDLEEKVAELSDAFINKNISSVSFQSIDSKTITGLSIPANTPFKIRVDSQFVYTRLDVFKGTTTLTSNRLVQSAVSGREYVVLSTTEVNAITLYLRTSSNFGEMTLNVEYDGVIKQSIAIQNNITAESYLAKKFLEELNLYDFRATELNEYTLAGNNLVYALSTDIKFRNIVTYNVFATANTLGFFRFMYSNVNIEGVGFFEIPVYISDASKITSLYCGITNPDRTLELQANDALHNGWNMMRFATTQLNRSSYSNNYSTLNEFRLYVEANEDTTIIVSIPSAITPPKAKIIFVDDHGYHDFMTTAYPDLKALGVPVTWAIQPGRLGESVPGAGTLLTASDIELLSKDANSEFSWHTYDSSQEQQMSAEGLRDMFQSAVTALRKLNILPQYFWRAAWKQNDAINAMSCANLADAFATWDGSYGCESIPFSDRYNIKRQDIHGKTETIISNMFRQLKCTHGLYVFYTHSIVQTMETGLESHITQAEWDIFINYLTTAINEGWLEGTTFNSLRVKYGNAIL